MGTMKDTTARQLSRWAPAFVALLSASAGFGASWAAVQAHINDRDVHMPFEEKVSKFIPRPELEARLDKMEAENKDDITEIKKKLDEIYLFLLEGRN